MPSATYAITDSSMMQGSMFLIFFKKIHQWLRDDKIDGKPHAILLDGHASHMSLDVIPFPMANNLVIL